MRRLVLPRGGGEGWQQGEGICWGIEFDDGVRFSALLSLLKYLRAFYFALVLVVTVVVPGLALVVLVVLLLTLLIVVVVLFFVAACCLPRSFVIFCCVSINFCRCCHRVDALKVAPEALCVCRRGAALS